MATRRSRRGYAQPVRAVDSLSSDELIVEANAVLAEIVERARNYWEVGDGNRGALDEGLAFATKAEAIVDGWLWHWDGGIRGWQQRLEYRSLEAMLPAEDS